MLDVVDDVEIIGSDEAKGRLKPEELDGLIGLWTDETYHPVDVSASAVEDLRKEFRQGLTEHLQEVIDQGDMLIARKGDKVIGMVRVYKLPEVDVYEIGKALVVPEERGKGVYSKLQKKAIAHLREKYGDVAILAGTKNNSVKNLIREEGWAEIGFENYLRIYGRPEDYIASRKEDIKQKGWTAFLYLPHREN